MSHNPYEPTPGGPEPPPPKRGMSTGVKVLIWCAVIIVVVPVVGIGLLFGACLLGAR
jgi:hypothetical protein